MNDDFERNGSTSNASLNRNVTSLSDGEAFDLDLFCWFVLLFLFLFLFFFYKLIDQ